MHESHSPCARLFAAGAALALTGGLTAALSLGSAPAAAASQSTMAYGGSAFGSYVNLGSVARSGHTAYTPMCTPYAGAKHSNRTAQLNLGAVGSIGAVTSATDSIHSGTLSRSEASTHTAATSLLGGVIRFQAVTTAAKVSHYRSGYVPRGTSVFVGLSVAGKTLPATPAPNSTYSLAGLGTLTLNGQHASSGHGLQAMTTSALNLVLNRNNLAGLPAGQILIGRSTATMRPVHRVASGKAFATDLSVSSLAGSGRTAAVYAGCGGTGNAIRSNDLAGVTIPNGVAATKTADSTVDTSDSAARTSSTSTDTIAGVRLLGGQVTLRAITTEAHASIAGGKRSVSGAGTRLVGLTVAGHAYATPAFGTQRHIDGLGTLYFGSSHKTSIGIVVYGLRLVLDAPNDGMPAGAVITVGCAYAGVL